MTFPSQTDLMWFAFFMLIIVVLTQLQEAYRKKRDREWEDG